MARSYAIIFLVFAIAPALDGFCPKIAIDKNFKLEEYMGYWYEVARYLLPDEAAHTCITENYFDQNGTVMFEHSQQDNPITGKRSLYQGKAFIIAKATVYIEFSNPKGFTEVDLVIGLEPRKYAVTYTCVHAEPIVAILTRERFPKEKILKEAEEVLHKNYLPIKRLVRINQQNCTYLEKGTNYEFFE